MYSRRNKTVVFSYDIDEMFDKVSMESSYISRSIKDEEGNYKGEDFALTHDEDDIYAECFRKGANNLASRFLKMCTDVDFEDDFSITFPDNKIKEKVLKSVDEDFTDALLYGVLANWFEVCGDGKLVEYCKTIENDKFKKLWNDTFGIRLKMFSE
ncbi:MAG: hypothetical protein NC410_08985 [Oscillibacter sp.]|nr:hypothetical protein [Oscillibacter sp.]